MSGTLRILGHTQPLELTATLEDAEPTGATLSTVAELDRCSWGMDFNKLRAMATTTHVEAQLRFKRASGS